MLQSQSAHYDIVKNKRENVTSSGQFGSAPASNKHLTISVKPSLAALTKQLLLTSVTLAPAYQAHMYKKR
jgi:hypothetical protein